MMHIKECLNKRRTILKVLHSKYSRKEDIPSGCCMFYNFGASDYNGQNLKRHACPHGRQFSYAISFFRALSMISIISPVSLTESSASPLPIESKSP
jgi:hypothetical protein